MSSKYIGIVDGKRTELEAPTTSSGVASAGLIAALGPDGKWSATMLPSTGGSSEDGSALNPFTALNVKKIADGKFHKVPENLENIVTRTQDVDGILIVEGVNTIL